MMDYKNINNFFLSPEQTKLIKKIGYDGSLVNRKILKSSAIAYLQEVHNYVIVLDIQKSTWASYKLLSEYIKYNLIKLDDNMSKDALFESGKETFTFKSETEAFDFVFKEAIRLITRDPAKEREQATKDIQKYLTLKL